MMRTNRRLVAVVRIGDEDRVCWINHAAPIEHLDFALFKVNLENTKYLEIDPKQIYAGQDISVIGIPNHEVHGAGKEMRFLKGHVTLSGNTLELNFPIPSGMSGSPLFIGSTVIGYATGFVRSEEIEESTEEFMQISNAKEVIHITEVRRATYYGVAFPFTRLKDVSLPVLDGKTLLQFVHDQNQK